MSQGGTKNDIGVQISQSASKATPANNDQFGFWDSVGLRLVNFTWSQLKAFFALAANGVTNGDSHDHNGGDGAQIAYGTLSGLPALGTAAYVSTGTFALVANGVTNGDTHDHLGGDGGQIAYSSLSGLPTLPTYVARTTFTPGLTGTTASGTSSTYSVQIGEYQRLGSIVYIDINLAWSAHNGTGNMKITGLPVTSANNGFNATIPVYWNNITLAAIGNKILAQVAPNSTEISLVEIGSAGGTAIPMDTAGALRFTGFYFV